MRTNFSWKIVLLNGVNFVIIEVQLNIVLTHDLVMQIVQTCRDNEQLSKYGDTKTARGIMLIELKKLIEANPLFRDKLNFPSLKNSRLRTLINQRLFSFFDLSN